MANIKNTPLYLNTSSDERRTRPEEMTDALNVHTVRSEADNDGVVHTVKGNSEVLAEMMPDGDNKCIGVILRENLQSIYYCIWNSNDNHSIFQYNNNTGQVALVLQDPVLNFVKNSYVTGEAQQGRSEEEILLYFTDNINPPRKVNVQKMLNGDYNNIQEEVITLIKYQPPREPTWEYVRNNSIPYNNLYNNNFQFRCRYVYDDGERSAYSRHSSLSYRREQLLTALKNDKDPSNAYNQINVQVPTGDEIVEEIEVIFRELNTGEWRYAGSVQNTETVTEVTFEFRNDGTYPVAAPRETSKYFDNVPLIARAIGIVNNRLFLGNYVDGYNRSQDLKNLTNNTGQITLNTNYNAVSLPEFFAATEPSVNIGYNPPNITTTRFEYSGAAGQVNEGEIFVLSFAVAGGTSPGDQPEFRLPLIYETEIADSGDSITDILNRLVGKVHGRTYNLGGANPVLNVTVVGGNEIKIKIVWNISSQFDSIDVQPFDNYSGKYNALSAAPSFKSGSSYDMAIIHYDEAGRASTAETFDGNNFSIPFLTNSRGGAGTIRGAHDLHYRIQRGIKPPRYAHRWSWAITRNNAIDEFIQYSSTAAYQGNTDVVQDASDNIYVSLRGLRQQEASYEKEFGSIIEYNFAEGDRLRVISYYDDDEGERVVGNNNMDFRVLNGQFYTEEDSPIYDSNNPGKTTGYILTLENPTVSGFRRQDIASDSSFWNADGGKVIFEIYRPKSRLEEDSRIFYEIGKVKEVENPGTDDRAYGDSWDGRDRSALVGTSSPLTFPVSATQSSANFVAIPFPTTNIVVGDAFNLLDASGNTLYTVWVNSIEYIDGDTILRTTNFGPGSVEEAELADPAAAGVIEGGDVWFRPRLMRNDNNVESPNFILFPVEDYNVSDFYRSAAWGQGRANAFTDEGIGQVHRFSTICYSDPYFNQTNVNGFSSFNLGDANFKQYAQTYGVIQRMEDDDVYLTVFQQNKLGRVPVNRQIIRTSTGEESLALSDDVLNDISYYKGDYGLTKPETFIEYDGDYYGAYIPKGKVWELGRAGIQKVSDYKMSGFFDGEFKNLLPVNKAVPVVMGLDREYNMILLTAQSTTINPVEGG